MKLPHTDYLETRSAKECVDLLKSDQTDEITLVASREFADRESQEIFPEVYTQYQIKYQLLIGEYIEQLDQPNFTGDQDDSHFPSWAVGEHVTFWRKGKNVYWLRLHHEESAAPIKIVLAKRAE